MKPIETVSIIGMGGLGVMFGKPLLDTLPRGAVRMIASRERVARYTASPTTCNGVLCDFPYIVPGDNTPPADLVLVAVKFPHMAQTMADMASQVGKDTVIVSLLNGISSEELLEEVWPGQVVYSVSIGMDTQRVGQEISYSRMGRIQLGEPNRPVSPRAQRLADFFAKAAIPVELCDDILFHQWNKWMLNVGCNQVCAALGANYRQLGQLGKPRDMMLSAMAEVVEIAKVRGVSLRTQHIAPWEGILAGLAPEGIPSMAQDVVAKRPSEVDMFGGTVCRLGKKYGIPTPTNQWLVERICQIENQY